MYNILVLVKVFLNEYGLFFTTKTWGLPIYFLIIQNKYSLRYFLHKSNTIRFMICILWLTHVFDAHEWCEFSQLYEHFPRMWWWNLCYYPA